MKNVAKWLMVLHLSLNIHIDLGGMNMMMACTSSLPTHLPSYNKLRLITYHETFFNNKPIVFTNYLTMIVLKTSSLILKFSYYVSNSVYPNVF